MKSNFNSVSLLCGLSTIEIIGEKGERYLMRLPLLKDQIENNDFETFLGFCATSIEEVNKQNKSKFTSKLMLLKVYKRQAVDVVKVVEKYLSKFMVGFKYVDDFIYWDKYIVSKELFDIFCDYCAIACGVKPIEDLKYVITKDMTEFEIRQMEMEKKIAKTKAKGQQGLNVELDSILAGVAYEFGYSFEQLREKTLYSIYFMFSQLNKITNYEITNIAMGNGLTKKNTKHGHWSVLK